MTTATTTAMTTTKIRVAAVARRDCGAWWRPVALAARVAPGGLSHARGWVTQRTYWPVEAGSLRGRIGLS
eukprot:75910-Heterocapsa_arctica.AAC.1